MHNQRNRQDLCYIFAVAAAASCSPFSFMLKNVQKGGGWMVGGGGGGFGKENLLSISGNHLSICIGNC